MGRPAADELADTLSSDPFEPANMTHPLRHPRQTARKQAFWGAFWGALFGGLLALFLFAPARWVGHLLSHATQGHLSLEAARGTVWQGSAELWLRGGEGSQDARRLPGRIEWQVASQFHWQTLPSLALGVQMPCCTPQTLIFQVQPGFGQTTVALADSHFLGSADILSGLGAPWNTLTLQGQLQLDSEQLRLTLSQGRLQVEGKARLQALDISSKLSTLKPLGSYQLVVSGGKTPELNLSTLRGSLLLEGEGQWVDGQLHFRGQAKATEDRENALNNLLNVIGQRDGNHARISLG